MQKNKLFLENELQVIYNQANRNDVSKKNKKVGKKMKEQGKMNLKRITCAIIAASTLVAVGSLSGCGKKSTGNNVNGEINVSIANWPLEDPELTKMNKKKECVWLTDTDRQDDERHILRS